MFSELLLKKNQEAHGTEVESNLTLECGTDLNETALYREAK